MFGTNPLGMIGIETDAIIDTKSRGIVLAASFGVDGIGDFLDIIFRINNFAAQNAFVGGRIFQRLVFLYWKLVSAVRAKQHGGMDDALTFRTLLLWSRTASMTVFVFDLYGIDRAMPQDIASVVQNETIGFRFVKSETATTHLDEQSRTGRRTQKDNAVDVRCVETGGQHVDVDQVFEEACRFTAFRFAFNNPLHVVTLVFTRDQRERVIVTER